jgi:hypothetical protein
MKMQVKIVFITIIYVSLAGIVFVSGCVEKNTTGYAHFSSVPSGAEIWIDGFNTKNLTPATLPDLKEANHTYVFIKEGYLIFNGTFYVKAGQTTNVPEISLVQQQAKVPSPTELKYYLLENVGTIFYCDPDFYPVARAGAEKEHALEQFPDIQRSSEEFQAILRHTNLEGGTNFSDEQKVVIYRELKKLNAILLEPSGKAYKFQLRISEEKGAVFDIEGIIDTERTITILKKEAGIGTCPICLDGNTRIDTPTGPIAVKNLYKGMSVWTIDASGSRTYALILESVRIPVSPGYRIVHIVLDDGRELFVSPGHPTADGRKLGDLSSGDILDGASVVIADQIPYEGTATYDILPSGDTGFYWANGILIRSTLTTSLQDSK